MTFALVIPAAGSGERLGAGIPKAFVKVDGITLLEFSIRPFLRLAGLTEISIAVPSGYEAETQAVLSGIAPGIVHHIVPGGARRQDSVLEAVKKCTRAGLIAIHDAARPFVNPAAIQHCLEAAHEKGAALLAVPAIDTIKQTDGTAKVSQTLDRSRIWLAQTPQIFSKAGFLEACAASDFSTTFTDDAAILEAAGFPVFLVEGNRTNTKITYPEDLKLLTQQRPPIKIGNGYDIHRLVPGRSLVLGGVTIPFELGLDGHSDADVLLHAVMDAMLGALALGDIGAHFPNTDDAWKDADSRNLLRSVMKLMEAAGYALGNLDVMVIAEKPKLMPHLLKMRQNIADDLHCPLDCISIKATTSEKIGHIGRLEGIEAHASVLLYNTQDAR